MSQTKQQPEESSQPQSLVVFEGFNGLNTQPSRYGVGDKQCFIMDGFFPAGNDNARVIPDNGPALFTPPAGTTIGNFDYANIGGNYYAIVFPSDGSIWAMNTDTLVQNQISGPGTTPGATQSTSAISQWGAQYILIVCSTIANGYFIWDGTTFYPPGASVPGMTTVPTGISGSAIETYGSHVWIANNDNIFFSAPGSVTDFATADGGGSFTSNDSTLRQIYSQLQQSNGYLYLFGDSSISYIAGVQTTTTGMTSTTTFSLQNVDPEVGTPWPASLQVLGSNIVMANQWGVHVSFGGRAAKVSSELNGIYNTANNFGGLQASSGKTILFGKRAFVLLLQVIDQITKQPVNKMFLWDEKQWCSTQQSANIQAIRCQEQFSILTTWGTDGNNLFRLFQTPSIALTKTLQSKFWAPLKGYVDVKAENRLWGLFQYFSGAASSLNISVDSENGSSVTNVPIAPPTVTVINTADQVVPVINNASVVVTLTSSGGLGISVQVLPPTACAQNGALVGLTISTNASDIAIISMATMPIDVQYKG